MSDPVRWPYKGRAIKAKAGSIMKDGTLGIKQRQFGGGKANNSGPAGKAKRFRQPNRRPYSEMRP